MKNCIIWGDNQKLHICETKRAKQFLYEINFNKDEVFIRWILCKTIGEIFAADAMYYKNCMASYIRKFHRDVSEILDDSNDQFDNRIKRELFFEMGATLKLDKEGYTVSDCWDTLNSNLCKAGVGKRSLFYLVLVLNHIFPPAKAINKVSMLFFNDTCISNIDWYCVAKRQVHLPKFDFQYISIG